MRERGAYIDVLRSTEIEATINMQAIGSEEKCILRTFARLNLW